MWRRLLVIGTLGAGAGIIICLANPVSNTMLKAGLLACVAATWTGLPILGWSRRTPRIALLALAVLFALPFALPARPIDPGELGDDYVRRMSRLEGTRYFWGGESARGIDCSGLPRKALRDGLLAYGLRHFNGHAIRLAAGQWRYDASAKALGKGYRGYTLPLATAGTIRTMDYSGLLPGDLAVTTSGQHILAYAGGGKWIQADPGIGAVATLDGRTADNVWFLAPVTTHRWQVLSPPEDIP